MSHATRHKNCRRFGCSLSIEAILKHPPVMGAIQTPSQILDERYAKGDLTTEEYLERVMHLGSA